MESIRELREICQKSRRSVDTWHGRYICRPLSIYITVIFLKLGLSANVATVVFFISGIAGSLLLTSGDRLCFFIGMVILQLWYLLDHVDGEVARYRKQTSLTGVYFDKISHFIVNPLIFACIGFELYTSQHSLALFLTSLLAGYSISMISISSDMVDNVLYDRIKGVSSIIPCISKDTGIVKNNKKDIFLRVFSFIHALCIFPAVMNIIFLASIIDLFAKTNSINAAVIFFAVCATLVWTARVSVFILQKKVDKEYSHIKEAKDEANRSDSLL